MPWPVVRACSCTRSFSFPCRPIRPAKVPVLSGHCTRCSSTQSTGSSPECSTWSPLASCLGREESSGSSMCAAPISLRLQRPGRAMSIERIELYQLTLPLIEPFIISGGTMTHRRSLVVIVYDRQGHRGYGESPPFELPFYSEETLAGARHLLQYVLIPRLLRAGVDSADAAEPVLSHGIRGNRFARAALDTALWDLEAARRNIGLARLLGERLGVESASRIACGVALGIPQDRSLHTLRLWVREALVRGYRRVKIKVAPGWDSAPVQATREAMAGSGIPLTVDANGAYE